MALIASSLLHAACEWLAGTGWCAAGASDSRARASFAVSSSNAMSMGSTTGAGSISGAAGALPELGACSTCPAGACAAAACAASASRARFVAALWRAIPPEVAGIPLAELALPLGVRHGLEGKEHMSGLSSRRRAGLSGLCQM
jgi:hypothetical protein